MGRFLTASSPLNSVSRLSLHAPDMAKEKRNLTDAGSGPQIADEKPKAIGRNGILKTFMQNQVSLRSFISRYMISTHDIEDVSQETFLRAYQAEQKKEIEQPRAFLFRIAQNLVLSELSKKSRKITDYIKDFDYPEVLLAGENLEDNIMAQQKLGIYCEAVASLPPQCRRAVLMKKVYGLSNREIARRMEIALSTVEKHLTKGIKQCNAVMTERYGEDNRVKAEKGDKADARISVSKRRYNE